MRDGYGIKRVMDAGITVAVISGRRSRSAAGRMAELGIRHVMLGREDKDVALDELLAQLGDPAQPRRPASATTPRPARHGPRGAADCRG